MEDYYKILGVDKDASDSQIKKAYREIAKKWHPDVNSSPEATQVFQKINNAYSVLGSPERKVLYDAGNYSEAIDPSTYATEAELYPVNCDGCGAISAQPRFIQYSRVFSLLFFSHKTKPCGTFCVNCASKRIFFSSFITGIFGWLGLWGFFWSIEAFFINIFGGIKNPALNAFILGKQAYYFHRKGNANIATSLARDSLSYFKKVGPLDENFELAKSGADVAKMIINDLGLYKQRLKSHWGGWSKPAKAGFFSFLFAAGCWASLIGYSDESKKAKKSQYRKNPATVVKLSPKPNIGKGDILVNFKNGKLVTVTAWYENGQKKGETNLKDGKSVTITIWKPNGEKCPITNMVDGNGVVVNYYKDGAEKTRSRYKDGEIVED
ncbi:DnaJ domain-containing protein [Opitutales bacterium]|nr:DnaJ domain-containing protein [Opitutales bacterium]